MSSPLVGKELFRARDNKLKLNTPELKEVQELFRFACLIKDVSASRGNNDARLPMVAAAAAAGAGAGMFVAGDKAILKRESSGAMRIVSPRDACLILFGPEAAA